MKRSLLWATLAVALSFSLPVLAQAPAAAPAGSTGLCKDGTYYSGPTKKGACRGHKGVKDWFGPAAPAASAAAAAPATAATPAAPAAPATPAAPAKPAKPSVPSAAAAGGGPGMVWVNTPSKVYHCPGSRWYGKTKQGEYMTEAAAKAQGSRPDHGKSCQ
jgi:hypothetical protein